MSYVFVFFMSLCYLTSEALAGSRIEFNITKVNQSSIQTLECNNERVLYFEVEDESNVPVVIRLNVTQIEQASCYREKPINTKIEKKLKLTKANYTRESQNNGNTFTGSMNITKEHQGLWQCQILINNDIKYKTMPTIKYNGRNLTKIPCQLNLIVIDKSSIDDFFSKYKYWIIGAACVAVLIIIIMITQTIVILQFRARVNDTKHIRPLSLIGRRHDRNNYGRTPGSQRTTSKEEPNHYEIVQAFELAPTPAPIQDVSRRPPLPLPDQCDYEEPPNNLSDGTLRSSSRTPSPPPVNTIPRRRRPQPEFEEECLPPTPPVIESKPPKTDLMISELGNRLRKRRDEESPLMLKKSFKSPQHNIPPPVPSKSQATAIRAHNMTDFETPHFVPPHQMPAKTSPHLRSKQFLQPHAPSHKTPFTPPISRKYIPEHIRMQTEEFHMPPENFHMQPENYRTQPDNFRMQPETFRMQQEQSDMQPNNFFQQSNGNMSLPKRKPAPQNMMGMHNVRFANHMKSTPNIMAALSERAQMQQQHMKFREPQAVKIPPPVQRKAGHNLQTGPAACKPRFPSPRTTTFEDNHAGSDEDWNYECLPPVNKYLNDY